MSPFGGTPFTEFGASVSGGTPFSEFVSVEELGAEADVVEISTPFKVAWNRSDRSAAVLVEVVLAPATGVLTKTLRLSTRDLDTPDGNRWIGAILDPGTVHAPGALLTSDVSLCTQTITLAGRAPLLGVLCAFDLMSGWLWIGARVTTYLWETSLTNIADAARVFRGTVLSVDLDGETLVLSCRQRNDWNQSVTPDTVKREQYPFAAEATVGASIPIWLGKVPQVPMRAPFAAPYANATANTIVSTDADIAADASAFVYGGKRVGRGVLVDGGRGAGSAKVLLASNELKSIGTPATGFPIYIGTDEGVLSVMQPTVTPFKTATGSGFYLDDDAAVAYYPLFPVEIGSHYPAGFGPPDNPRGLLEKWNENKPTVFDIDNGVKGKNYLALTLPVVMNPGNILIDEATAPDFYLVMAVDSTNGTLTWRYGYSGVGVPQVGVTSYGSDSATPNTPRWWVWKLAAYGVNTWAAISAQRIYLGNWETDPPPTPLQTVFPTGVTKVYACGLVVTYAPRQSTKIDQRVVSRPPKPNHSQMPHGPYADKWTVSTPVSQVESEFFAHVEGQPDDASGTYSGVASALIERPCDIARWMLARYGGQTADQLETALETVGSFVDARSALKTWRKNDMVLGLNIAEPTDVSTALAMVCDSSAMWVHLSPYTDKWHCTIWGAPAQAVTRTLRSANFVELPKVSLAPGSSIAPNVKVPYGYDLKEKSYAHEVSVAPDKSAAGHAYFDANDQSVAVVAGASDRLDLTTGAGSSGVAYATGVRVITRASGSFVADGWLPGMHVVSDLPGIEAGTRISAVYTLSLAIDPTSPAPTTTAIGAPTAANCTYDTSHDRIQRASGSFVTDGFIIGKVVTSSKSGIPTNTVSGPRSFSTDGKTMYLSATPTVTQTGATITQAGGATITQVRVATLVIPPETNGTMSGMMDALHTALRSPSLLGSRWAFACGGHPRWRSHLLDYDDGTVRACSIIPVSSVLDSDLQTMEEVAAAAVENLNANGSTGYGCTYSRTTKKFTLTKSSGTFALLFGSGSNYAHTCAASLGFKPDDRAAAASHTSDYAIEEGRFLLTSSADFRLLFRTGPNGWLLCEPMLTAHSALGLSPYDDTVLARYAYGSVSKGTLQATLAQSVARYISDTSTGPARRELVVEGRAIYDTDTALEVRNRVALLSRKPPTIVHVQVENVVGVERGERFQFDAEMDALRPYPDPDGNGSWVGKALVVLETEQHLGPDSFFTEVVALDTDTGFGWGSFWNTGWGG